MKILLTGVTGYIGRRLMLELAKEGHHIVCCTRDANRFSPPNSLRNSTEVIEIDLLKPETLENIPKDIDAAYYLVHSMAGSEDYQELELKSAENFRKAIDNTNARQVIFLSGIINDEHLSKHLQSRKNVENQLSKGKYHCTTLRAGIIIGSGSASFEIIRDLVEKLPIMIAPKWLNTKCQPIGIADVLCFLTKSLGDERTYDQNFDIGCPDILTYKEMLLKYAEARGLKRSIGIVPVMTPKLSSYWLYFITSTSYNLAINLVDSMKIEVICRNNDLAKMLDIHPISYMEAVERALAKVQDNSVISSWKDSFISGDFKIAVSDFVKVPTHGCFVDTRKRKVKNENKTLDKLWSIGGRNGWYYGNWLWQTRGFIDKLWGGVGLRRGRTSTTNLQAGDTLDFWRVLFADKTEKRLLLFAEMKLPGEAWLEFEIKNNELKQTATFRPKGLWGRLYWFSVFPFHGFIFKGMLNSLIDVEDAADN
ncbi:SDR family oxidoreductase [Cryomorpha ignava]|uniref:SDR family oxidoreductase n=1 Tax=Cryomorpha ignava TaxID=101383 RepID=A0A7K3WSJ9_9FLAO|nr:SDR family oxidoreductase [Cryomorpha ignava]NEN24663.1 SDR family oxidoreductase [Cryomorpha ignava]